MAYSEIDVQFDNGFTESFQEPRDLKLYDNGQTGKVLATLLKIVSGMVVHSCHLYKILSTFLICYSAMTVSKYLLYIFKMCRHTSSHSPQVKITSQFIAPMTVESLLDPRVPVFRLV